MQITVEVPITDEELQNEMEEQTREFRRLGLLPIEEGESSDAETDSN